MDRLDSIIVIKQNVKFLRENVARKMNLIFVHGNIQIFL